MQAAVYGGKSWFNGRLTLGGFLDYNVDSKKIVTEWQGGVRVSGFLSLVVEGRYNGFLPEDNAGVGIGLEWNI